MEIFSNIVSTAPVKVAEIRRNVQKSFREKLVHQIALTDARSNHTHTHILALRVRMVRSFGQGRSVLGVRPARDFAIGLQPRSMKPLEDLEQKIRENIYQKRSKNS